MKRVFIMLLCALTGTMALSQDGGTTNVDVNLKGDGGAAGFPWLWVVIGIVLLVVIIAVAGGRSGSDRVVHRKTIIKE